MPHEVPFTDTEVSPQAAFRDGPPRCVALLSGGLDSMLAIRLMQQQQIEVEALHFKTMFGCCQDRAGQAARQLGVRLTVVAPEDDYLDLVRRPRFGYGRGANPCVDCRIYMFQRADEFRRQVGAEFVISGEVLGQRPKSQKRRDLEVIAHHAGLGELLLRPLSARRLPPTRPEREGWVDRAQLGDFVGRSRQGLIRLARQFGFPDIPAPSSGCALTDPGFGRKVLDLVRLDPRAAPWDFELLKIGRHVRHDPRTKVVVGRNERENAALDRHYRSAPGDHCALLVPENFTGPSALVVGDQTDGGWHFAASLILRHARKFDPHDARIAAHAAHAQQLLRVAAPPEPRDSAAPPAG